MYSRADSVSGLWQLRHASSNVQQLLLLGQLGVLQQPRRLLARPEPESGLRELRDADEDVLQFLLLGELGVLQWPGFMHSGTKRVIAVLRKLWDEETDLQQLMPV